VKPSGPANRGMTILSDTGCIMMGKKKDVDICRTGIKEMSFSGDVKINGKSIMTLMHQYGNLAKKVVHLESKIKNLMKSCQTTPPKPGCSPTVLFEAPGNSGTYRNTWTGWYSTGNTVSSGNGKRAAYDAMSITGLRLSDASGRFAEYDLSPAYAGKTLQSIVSTCMGSNRNNNNSGSLPLAGSVTVARCDGRNVDRGEASLRTCARCSSPLV
jgi:hypothetical protein